MFIEYRVELDRSLLQFKDKALRVNYELLVTPDDQVHPEIIEYVTRTARQAQAQLTTRYTTPKTSASHRTPAWIETYSVTVNGKAKQTRELTRQNAYACIGDANEPRDEPQ